MGRQPRYYVPDSPGDEKKHGEDIYVTPHEKGWALNKEKDERFSAVYSKKIEAVSKARSLAGKYHGNLVIQCIDCTI